jgi:signal transduction histidine kinase
MRIRLDGLRLQLLLVLVFPFGVMLVLLALASVRVHQQAMRRLVAERDEWAARSAASAISEQLHHRQSSISSMASHLSEDLSPEALLQEESDLLADFDRGMAVTDHNGRVLASNPGGVGWTTRPIISTLTSLDGPQAVFSLPFDEEGQVTVLVLAAPDEGNVVVGAFTVSSLMRSAMLGLGSSEAGASAFLADDAGRLLASLGPPPKQNDLLDHTGVRPALLGEEGSSFVPGTDGEHVVSYSPVRPTGWALVIEEPWEIVSSPMLNLSLLGPLALVPALLLTLVALWFGARQVIEPLRRLEAEADKLAAGDFSAGGAQVGGIAEIRHLQSTLDTMAGKIRSSQDALRGYINSITRAQEEERLRLARELHDSAIQDLIALDQQIQMLSLDHQGQGVLDDPQLSGLHQAAQRTVEELRRVSRGLRPVYLEDLGLVPALETLAREMSEDLGIPVSFRLDGLPRRFSSETELALYRIVQESLSNVARHASARQASVAVRFGGEELEIEVADDGLGFAPPEHPGDLTAGGHYGLLGMHERAEIVGADLELNSEPGRGTRVRVRLTEPSPGS